MVIPLTRKLLRDWKHICRSTINKTTESKRYVLKPQDTNVHIWHLLLLEPVVGLELYFILYVDDNVLSLRCLTPNENFPLKMNVNISYMWPILRKEGFFGLIMKLWYLFYGGVGTVQKMEPVSRLLKAWNRIMYRNFTVCFPEVTGYLQEGDYEMVKDLSKQLKEYQHCGAQPIIHSKMNEHNRTNIHESFEALSSHTNDEGLRMFDDVFCPNAVSQSPTDKRNNLFRSDLIIYTQEDEGPPKKEGDSKFHSYWYTRFS
ncbi:Ubs1p KNAG_0A03810 [Huiozyma naganishii CBS 8797]|uniref:Uncharacterized protein n=1 Tax=Huiozyma naganishii (strain ATCC MYA-139 / BCRC 22969 / CBS 8797 / KCTC 17520 / NBRC 10181 / NCYC 3082 / Yp74L-3) TaxID=1071383 RepID=J7S3M4_HUIN7|nr:hypothetical protein KNAG_0A03810 [Kazachstania naganishii CBS 8797]CCK68061.1 hypothetical protein KNAG_0A03810 [Kazachstania naganishii CBS 8797]